MNAGKSFIGSYVLGMGFVLSEEEALAMIECDPKNRDVLFPYLNGKDLNTHPEQKPSRRVINFWDWPEEKAKEYEEPYRIVLERVKLERQKLNTRTSTGRRRKEYWWLYASDAKSLYHAIGRGHAFMHHPVDWAPDMEPMGRVLACSRVSKTGAFSFLSNDWVYSDAVVVFAMDDDADFSVMQSSIHEVWARKYSSSLETRLRYTPTDVFETLPFPDSGMQSSLGRLGDAYHLLRANIMDDEGIGLTKLYNRFHNADERDAQIDELRDLHRQIDEAVSEAYGWTDLYLEHDFHKIGYLPENDNIRFTISEKARIEVLRRLARLNKERYEEEIAQGLHSNAKGAKKKSPVKKRRSTAKVYDIPSYSERDIPKAAEPGSPQMDIFSDPSPLTSRGNQWGSEPIDQILAWLEAHPGWHTKKAILNGCEANPVDWNEVISELLEEGFIESNGKGKTRYYRAVL